MAGSLTVRQARIVLADRVVVGDLVVEDGVVSQIAPRVDRPVGLQVDGRGCALLPGAIDTCVHLDACEDLAAVSAEATAGGVTSVLGVRTARTAAELRAELCRAAELSRVHFGLYQRLDRENGEARVAERARGLWIDGALLFDDAAEAVFATADRPLVVDAADPARLAERAALYGNVDAPREHPKVIDVDTTLGATRRAVELATRHRRPTHLLHLSTAEEVALLAGAPPHVTAAARLPHLFLDEADLDALGTRAVTEPPVRGGRHRQALWEGLAGGAIDLVASGHRPVRAEAKDRPYPGTHPGLPGVEWLLPLLLDAAAQGRCGLPDVARWIASGPAEVFRLPRKGRLEVGFDGDLCLVDLTRERTVGVDAPILTQAGWSPWQGRTLRGWPALTVVSGEPVWREGELLSGVRGRPL